jgi:trigger factor
VTLNSVKERELPELDDDFAQLASEFDTLDELRADLRQQAERSKAIEQGIQARDRLLDALLEASDVPVPEALIEAEVHSHLENENRLDDHEHGEEVGENARKGLQTQFLLDAIVEKEKVSVAQPELIEYLVMNAAQYGMEPNEFAKAVEEAGQVPAMVGEVARRKALALVLEQATVTDASGRVVDLEALRPEPAVQPEIEVLEQDLSASGDTAGDEADESAESTAQAEAHESGDESQTD